jgi:hypothetical protein
MCPQDEKEATASGDTHEDAAEEMGTDQEAAADGMDIETEDAAEELATDETDAQEEMDMDLEDDRSPASRAKVDVVCLDDLHPRLYVGSKKSLKHPDCLRELGVTVVFVLNDSKMQFKKHDGIMYVCGLFWLVSPLNSLLHFPLHSPQFPSAQCLSPQFHITLSPPFPSIPLRPMFVCGVLWLVYPLNSILHFPLHSPPFPSAQSLTPLNSISNSPHDSPHVTPPRYHYRILGEIYQDIDQGWEETSSMVARALEGREVVLLVCQSGKNRAPAMAAHVKIAHCPAELPAGRVVDLVRQIRGAHIRKTGPPSEKGKVLTQFESELLSCVSVRNGPLRVSSSQPPASQPGESAQPPPSSMRRSNRLKPPTSDNLGLSQFCDLPTIHYDTAKPSDLAEMAKAAVEFQAWGQPCVFSPKMVH